MRLLLAIRKDGRDPHASDAHGERVLVLDPAAELVDAALEEADESARDKATFLDLGDRVEWDVLLWMDATPDSASAISSHDHAAGQSRARRRPRDRIGDDRLLRDPRFVLYAS